tara:strand:- start:12 stop:1091 length:1080 start_codon:yes stop_codon:yes gene_type:complete
MTKKRDYSLMGENTNAAIEAGLVSAEWYHPDIPRSKMKALMKRSNGPAIRSTIIWLGLMAIFGGCAFVLWPSWWSVPFFLAYGVLYGSASDSRWHECGHRTAFKARWMNDVVYQVASFMMIRNPTVWRWSHTRHHTDTYIVGHDPEIAVMKPPVLFLVFLGFFGLVGGFLGLKNMVQYSVGIIIDEQKTFIPEAEQPKVIFVARIWVLIYAAVIIFAISIGSILPLIFVGLPTFYGAWHGLATGLLQHGGLADNVLDHRLNSRTVYINPISRFIYWNMNYHIEHHMFPMVPFHKLPELHELLKDDMPAPDRSMFAAYRKIWPVWMRQLKNEDCFLKRELPPTARPYKEVQKLKEVATTA